MNRTQGPRTHQQRMCGLSRAFDGEAEAKQHLSEAQLNASTALAAADPFTERIQRGDKVLYRARFAGFDKETAEIACKQLKRGHFECMALKN
jgi:D-alanyl-D-alanine carboxypeptidase